jgi:Mg-chelatase subunit ChlD
MHYGGGIRLDYAVSTLENAEGYAYKSIVIFTDGQENASKSNVDDVIERAKSLNIKVFAIDFGAGIDSGYMSKIARGSGGKYYHIYGSHEFKDIFRDIYI